MFQAQANKVPNNRVPNKVVQATKMVLAQANKGVANIVLQANKVVLVTEVVEATEVVQAIVILGNKEEDN
jgi:hypothetical protein